MKNLYSTFALLAAILVSSSALAQNDSPVGLWKNINDTNGKPRAMIRITESQGLFQGRIERVFTAPGEGPDPKCVKCEGENRNASVTGLLILTGLRKSGDEYVDGQILDPDTGSVYRSKMKVIDNGQKLDVRGFIGIPLLGRTQTWIREN